MVLVVPVLWKRDISVRYLCDGLTIHRVSHTVCTMNVMSSSHSEMGVCWRLMGEEKERKGGKEKHGLCFYRDELMPV